MTFRILLRAPTTWVAFGLTLLVTVFFAVRPDLALLGALPIYAISAMMLAPHVTPFEATLPVHGRAVALPRIVLTVALLWVPALAWIVADRAASSEAEPLLGPGIAWKIAAVSIVTVIGLLPFCVRPRLVGPAPTTAKVVPWLGLAALSGASLYFLDMRWAATVLALAAAGTLMFAWRAIPASYQLAGVSVAAGVMPRASGESTASAITSEGTWWRPVLKTLVNRTTLFGMLSVSLMAIGDNWMFWFVMFTVGSGLSGKLQATWLRTLPFSSRMQVWSLLGPALAPLLGILLVGKLVVPLIPPLRDDLNSLTNSAPHEYSRDDGFDKHTRVPLAFWNRAVAGKPGEVRAPWGETSPADTLTVLGAAFYNPYSALTKSSDRFKEWQFARATTAVYGKAIPRVEYDAKDFVPPPRVTSGVGMLVAGGALMVLAVLVMAWLVEAMHWHRLKRLPGIFSVPIGVSLVLLVYFGVTGLDLYYSLRHSTVVVVPLAERMLMPFVARFNILELLILALVPISAGYALLSWQARRSEWIGARR